jgi:hypothetical protein
MPKTTTSRAQNIFLNNSKTSIAVTKVFEENVLDGRIVIDNKEINPGVIQ